MSERELRRTELTLEQTLTLGGVLAKSGYFPDARQAEQAVVKILAGQELGIGPIASMSGVSIVKGHPSLGANLMAALIRRSGQYDYRVERLDNESCELVFLRQGVEAGRSAFTAADAKKAGLGGDVWSKYPRNMLFARAMSNGARWYCPDAFAGQTAYETHELCDDAGVDTGTGEIIEAATTTPPVTTPEAAKPENGKGNGGAKLTAPRLSLERLIRDAGIDRTQFKCFLSEHSVLPVGEGYQSKGRLTLDDLPEAKTTALIKGWARTEHAFREWIAALEASASEEDEDEESADPETDGDTSPEALAATGDDYPWEAGEGAPVWSEGGESNAAL